MTIQPLAKLSLPLMLLVLAVPSVVHAQVDTTRTVLPDIAPREFEIRGPLEISFPSLRRQPLIGFNPPPRVPNIPADRQPYVESFRDASSMLSSSTLARPQPPSALQAVDPAQGEVEALAGWYYSRGARARITLPVSSTTAVVTRLDYQGSDGHQPFDRAEQTEDEDPIRARFDAAEGKAGVSYTGMQVAGGATMDGFYTTYTLYGAQPFAPGTTNTLLPQPERDGRGFGLTGHLRTIAYTAVDARAEIRYGLARYETHLEDTDDAALGLVEQRLEGRGTLRVPAGALDVWAEGYGSTSSLADDFGSFAAADAGAGLQLTLGRRTQLRIGGRFVGASSDTRPTDDDVVRLGYASPDLRLEVTPVTGIRLYAQQRPGVEPNALTDVFRENPYLVVRPELRPNVRTIDAEAGIGFFAGPVQISARGGYRQIPQFLFFETATRSEMNGYRRGFTGPRYAEADVYHAGGHLSTALPIGLHASIGATYRDGRLTEQDDAEIPYFSPIVGEAAFSFAFDDRRGLFQVTGHYESPRRFDRQSTEEVGAYVDLDVEASYQITSLVGIVVRAENLGGSDNQRWAHYPVSPVVIGAGLRLHW